MHIVRLRPRQYLFNSLDVELADLELILRSACLMVTKGGLLSDNVLEASAVIPVVYVRNCTVAWLVIIFVLMDSGIRFDKQENKMIT